MRLSAVQFGPTGNAERNLETIGRLVAQAAADGADLALLPEESMLAIRHLGTENLDEIAAAVADAWPKFVDGIREMAVKNGLAVIGGAYEPSETNKPYNTVIGFDAEGNQIAKYRKLHLYDAFDQAESDHITQGDGELASFELGGVEFGVLTCYDIRFPEVARKLSVDHNSDVLLVPSAWYSGVQKIDHWRTFVKARALENTVWVVAADTMSDDTMGHSMIVDPLSEVIAAAGAESEAVISQDISLDRISEVRRMIPVLKNRRSDIFD